MGKNLEGVTSRQEKARCQILLWGENGYVPKMKELRGTMIQAGYVIKRRNGKEIVCSPYNGSKMVTRLPQNSSETRARSIIKEISFDIRENY